MLDTTGHGCSSDRGIGKGKKYASCAGTGGANGGNGGYGGIEDHDKMYQDSCRHQYPMAFSSGIQANYEGSGGGSGKIGEG